MLFTLHQRKQVDVLVLMLNQRHSSLKIMLALSLAQHAELRLMLTSRSGTSISKKTIDLASLSVDIDIEIARSGW